MSAKASGVAGVPIVQIFGRKDSQATRRCIRFFKERRMAISLVEVDRRPPAPAELRRFAGHAGARALLDERSAAYTRDGLAYLIMDEEEVMERLLADPSLLRLPLVRFGTQVSIGVDEAAWRRWHRDGAAAPPAQ